MTDSGALDRLATLAGIEPGYQDIWNTRHETSALTKRRLLAAMGIAAATDAEAEASLEALEGASWHRPLPPVVVARVGRPIEVPVKLPQSMAGDAVEGEIVTETGTVHAVILRPATAPLEDSRIVDGVAHERRRVRLAVDLPPGYHRLRLPKLGGNTMRLIIAPDACHLPDEGAAARAWGITVHVYALRSPRNWGIGDFTDLADLAAGAARHGAATLGINPLHALFPSDPERASPYQPSSRLFLNPLYIDIEDVPEFAASPAARQVAAAVRPEIDRLRATQFVDYTGVARLKYRFFHLLFQEFRRTEGGRPAHPERAAAFARFEADGGERLRRFAEFEALSEVFEGKSWIEWPEDFRSPTSAAVQAFIADHPDKIAFHAYLQWLCDDQLAAAQGRATDAGMPLGLYRDLAVGVDVGGSDGWSDQGVVVTGASIGCPPDPFNMLGQNWGMPPLSPHALRELAYEPFIAMVRSNMRHAGALRIDHAMGLMHLFCLPEGESAAHGAYLEYPFEDLLGIVALESQRQRCVVIGEDLGTVPNGFRERMEAANILSYRVLYFEKDDKGFKRPDDYPEMALACVTTHDLATLAGFWTGADILLRKRLDLYPSPAVEQSEWESRQHDRHQMVEALQDEGLVSIDPEARPQRSDAMPAELVAAIHGYLARSPARYVMVQFDDIAAEPEQINLPGTVDEHPNWRRRLSTDLDVLLTSPLMAIVARAMAERHAPPAKPGA
jgi:4-alpha-glucanotransferase